MPLDDTIVKKYEYYRSNQAEKTERPQIPFGKIIRPAGPPPPGITFWHDSWGRLAKGKTKRIISEKTSWDEKGYGWFSPLPTYQYSIGDRILLFNFYNRVAQIVEVKDLAKLATPEGHHFVAFGKVPGFKDRKMGRKLWFELKSIGVLSRRDEADRRRKIPGKKWDELLKLFRKD